MILRHETDFAGGSTQGSRESQQDAYAFLDPDDAAGGDGLLLVLADGMGGHKGGSIASETAVQAFFDAWFDSRAPLPQERLLDGLEAANGAILDRVKESAGELEGMGTTLVAVLMQEQNLWWVSVGDSPLFLYRDSELLRLNEEHSMRRVLVEKVLAGEMSTSEMTHHPERNQLLAALTGEPLDMVDAPSDCVIMRPGDLILASSDGILTLDSSGIERILEISRDGTAREITRKILAAVEGKRARKQDNTTVAVMKAPAPQAPLP